jgi:hypothetical protein
MNVRIFIISAIVLVAMVIISGGLTQQSSSCTAGPGTVKFEWHNQAFSINVLPSLNGGDTGGSSGYDGSVSFRMTQTRGIHTVTYTAGSYVNNISVNFSESACYDLTEV